MFLEIKICDSSITRKKCGLVIMKTIDITTRLYGVNHTNPYIIPPKLRSDVYCF